MIARFFSAMTFAALSALSAAAKDSSDRTQVPGKNSPGWKTGLGPFVSPVFGDMTGKHVTFFCFPGEATQLPTLASRSQIQLEAPSARILL